MQMFQLLSIKCFRPPVSACVFSREMSVCVCSHDSCVAFTLEPLILTSVSFKACFF